MLLLSIRLSRLRFLAGVITLCFVMLDVLSTAAFAIDQVLTAERTISLEQALQIANRSNRDIEQATLAVRQTQAALQEQQASYNPNVTLSTGGDYDFPVTSNDDDSSSLSGGVDLSYTLLDFGRRRAAVDISFADLQIAELELREIQQTVRLNIATLYYELQNAVENVRINQAAVANSEQNLRDTQIREEAGVGTHYDSLQAQTQLADDRVNLLNAENERDVVARELVQAMGIGETTQTLSVEPIEQRAIWELSLEETIERAYQTRAEIAQQRLEQTIQQNQARLARAERSPEISLSTGYDFANSLLYDADSASSWSDGFNISVDMDWTLYDGGVANAQVRQAQANEAIALSELANQQAQIRLEVESAYLSLQSQAEQINVSEIGIVSAQEGLRLARLRFQSGVGTQLEVLEAQSDLTNAQSTFAQAITAYNQSIAELERAVSDL
ncbi:MAG: TolC family protein [Cyanobacteria bacterium J06581_3]